MIRLIFFLVVLLAIGCGRKTERKPEIKLTEFEIETLLMEWKKDSIGCLRTRDPAKMRIYANELIGKDSIKLISALGPPNYRYGEREERHFVYVLECARDQTSYFNFYFHFERDTVKWFSNPVQ